MKNITKALIPLVLFAATSAHALTINIVGTNDKIGNTSQPVIVNVDANPTILLSSQYDDLLARCTSFVTDIEMVKRNAQLHLGQGKVAAAAEMMNLVLQAKAAQIPPGYQTNANPHTMMAIAEAARIAQVSFQAIESARKILKQNTDMLKMRMIEQLTELVLRAHYTLDVPYFYKTVLQCHSYGCYQRPVATYLPQEYYNGVQKLSADFLMTYFANSNLMALDAIELSIASHTAVAAANFLSTSLHRRDFACPVHRLLAMNTWINSEMQTDSSPKNLEMVTGETRYQLGIALDSIKYGCN